MPVSVSYTHLPEPTPELKSVTVTAESKKVKVGEETTVTAKVDPTDAKDVTIIWTTSDEKMCIRDRIKSSMRKILVQYNSYDEIRQKMQQKVYYKINRNF